MDGSILPQQQLAEISYEIALLRKQLEEVVGPNSSEYWLATRSAVEALRSQGVTRTRELTDYITWGVLPINNEHVRDTSMGNGRCTYEFNIPKCAEKIAWWKGLTPDERFRFRNPG